MLTALSRAALNRWESGPWFGHSPLIPGSPKITGGESRQESNKDGQQPGGLHTDMMHRRWRAAIFFQNKEGPVSAEEDRP